MLDKIKNYFKTRRVGFYLVVAGAILLYVASLVYTVSFRNINHAAISYSIWLSIIPIITVLVVGCMLVFDETAPFSPIPLLVGQFGFLLMLANQTYMYLSDYFFEMSSFSDFARALKGLDSGYVLTAVLILFVFILGTVSLFFKVCDTPFVQKVDNTTKGKKAMLISSKALTYVMVALFGLTMVGGQIALDNSSAINTEFHIASQEIINPVDTEHMEKYTYYKSNFDNFNDVLVSGKNIARESVGEGATLLLNNNNVLPFAENTGVTLFGATSVFPVLSGTGSGAWIDSVSKGSTLYKTGFEQAGLKVNPDLFNFYVNNATKYCRDSANGVGTKVDFTIGEAKWDDIKDVVDASIADYKHAIFIVGRQGGEGKDFKMTTGDKNDMTDGNYLTLSPKEISVFQKLKEYKEQGKISDITVIMNSAYQVCGFDEDYGIDAMIWSGSIGTYGTYAIGDILTGKINPSGRLSDTFWTNHMMNPANYNFGDFTYSDRTITGEGYDKYVVYQEGMYMGYRYSETRYEDKILGTSNVGTFDYYDTVSYPFGYGLSYTNFDYSDLSCDYNSSKDEYNISVKVKNTGSVAGKEAVQLYLSKPYTSYDKYNHIEIPSVGLIDYAKTGLLAANETETISFKVPRRELASYDAYNKKTYILEAGDFMFTIGKDAHDAVNNVLIAKGKTTSDTLAKGNTGYGDAALVKKVTIEQNDYKSYAKSLNGTDITNAFDTADIKIFEPNGENKNAFEWTTRSNWADTVATKGVSLKRTNKMDAYYQASLGAEIKPDTTPQPRPAYGVNNNLQLVDLRAYPDDDLDPTNDVWIDFDDPLWDDFLDQLTWEECVKLLSRGQRHTEGLGRLGKPETLEHNGGVGFKTYNACVTGRRLASESDVKNYRQKIINYPCNGTVASTFNKELTYKMGVQWGEDALWTGHNMLYGPGNNLHRSAYNGRNFEYYSEDPILTGFECRVLDEGMATKGAYAYLKHCVLNDQETNRQECINTWCPEQAIRELYLKAFQIPIENGPITGVMTGFDGLGPVWTSAQGFCKQVLHGEFGMKGVAISDYIGGNDYMTKIGDALIHGGDLPDGEVAFSVLNAYKNNHSEVEWAMRKSLHYMMYQTVHTNVMNGITPNTRMVEITPLWVSLISVGRAASGILLVGSVAFLTTTCVLININKPLKKRETEGK